MNNTRHQIVFALIALHTLFAASCSDPRLTGKNKDTTALSDVAEIESQGIAVTDGQEYQADAAAGGAAEPVIISGAYLGCRLNYKANSATSIAVACSIAATEAESKTADRVTYAFSQKDEGQMGLPLTPLSAQFQVDTVNKTLNWSFDFDRRLVTKPLLHIVARDSSPTEGSPAIYEFSLATAKIQTMGLLTPNKYLQLGTNGGNLPGCDNIFENNAVPNNSPLYSRKILVKSANAQLKVNISVCGMNNGGRTYFEVQSLVLGLATTPTAKVIFTADINNNNNTAVVAFEPGSLQLGEHTLNLNSGFYSARFGYDDVIIRAFDVIAVSGEIELLPLPVK